MTGLKGLKTACPSFQIRSQELMCRHAWGEPKWILSISAKSSHLLSLFWKLSSESQLYLGRDVRVLLLLINTKPWRMILVNRQTNNSTEELLHRCNKSKLFCVWGRPWTEIFLFLWITEDCGSQESAFLVPLSVWSESQVHGWLDNKWENAKQMLSPLLSVLK